MLVGVAKETKTAERRVALTPGGARELVASGHRVIVERGAGAGSRYADADYEAAGARIAGTDEVWADSELLLKVKEPTPSEHRRLHPGLTLFTFLHLAADPDLTQALVDSGTTAIAYETIEDEHGRLPLLAPMSEVAGRLATQAGAYFMQSQLGGSGVLIGGVPGVDPARVLVVGGGAVGTQAARVAVGMGAQVTVLERSPARIRELEAYFDTRARVLMSDAGSIAEQVADADVVIGAVLIPGARAPRLISRAMLSDMRPGTVVVDVAIDQGGCVETAVPTSHADPVYEVEGVVHYCVSNMPGAVPVTSTRALTNATRPYVQRLADLGVEAAIDGDPGLAKGLNVAGGQIVCEPVAEAFAGARRAERTAVGA
ncbi:MAG TPA: alanine dehydrogenase [Thermoleophilaceae bacterium]|nr:alanine dehydrogenase [Thermoleophilaceae bacterium]